MNNQLGKNGSFARLSVWRNKIYSFVNRDWDKLDLLIMAVLFAICYFSFSHSDIMVTGNRSFFMHTNALDFYDACYNWTGDYGANYLPSTFWAFAIWNIPLRLFGRVPNDVWTNSLLNTMWYKLLPVVVFFISAILVYKICVLAGFGEVKARVCKYAFLVCPIAVFSQMIFSQYDVFTVFFILLGYYYFLKKDHWKFILFFGIAATFKYQAIIYFLVFLILKEKRIFRIIRDTFLLLIPLAVEMLIYYPSANFRRSVLGFSALGYVNTGLDLGGLRPVSLFLAAILILLIAAYLKKPNQGEEIFQWSIYYANGVSFAFFGLVAFHPQWLFLIVPFLIISIMQNKNSKLLLILQNIFIIVLYILVVQILFGEQLLERGVFKYLIPSSWAVKMSDFYSYNNQNYLFTCIWVILLVYFVLSHPRFIQTDKKVIEPDTMVNIRINMLVGIAAWSIPSVLCLFSAIKGEYLMVNNGQTDSNMPIAIAGDTVITQTFSNTAEEIYDVQLFIGNYGRVNQSVLEVAFIDSENNRVIAERVLQLDSVVKDNTWYSVLEEGIDVEPGKDYIIELKSDAGWDNCIAVFSNGIYNEDNELRVNGELENGEIEMKIKGRS